MEKQKETAEIDIISLNDVCKISVSEKVVIPLAETFHEEIEIKLCLSGSFYVAISDNVLKHEPGNISIVNPYEVHSIFSGIEEGQTGEYCCLIIGLNCLDYIENQDVKEGLKKGTIKFNNFIEKDERIQEIIEHIVYEEKGNYPYKNWVLKSLIVELFALLLRDQQQGSLLNEGSNLALRDLIAPSLSYIHINYASKITLEKLSGLCNFSKNHAECEYLHNCETIWPGCAYGDPNHWRNNMYATFYCTHSLGPIIHMTGLRPVSVTGFESAHNDRADKVGRKGASFGIEMVTLENGAIVRSMHGGTYKDSIWWCLHGTKGLLETAREEADNGRWDRIYVNYDEEEGVYGKAQRETYMANEKDGGISQKFEHGGSDFWSMYHFVEKIKGDENAEVIDIYEALDMFLPGMFAHRSILQGGIPMEIPNLRNKAERDKWRNDVACTYPEIAGEQLLPTRKGGTPVFPDSVYARQKEIFEEQVRTNTGRFAGITGTKKGN